MGFLMKVYNKYIKAMTVHVSMDYNLHVGVGLVDDIRSANVLFQYAGCSQYTCYN